MVRIDFEDFLVWAYSRPKGKETLDFDEYLKEKGLRFNKRTKTFEQDTLEGSADGNPDAGFLKTLREFASQCQTEEHLKDPDRLNELIKGYSFVLIEKARKEIAATISVEELCMENFYFKAIDDDSGLTALAYRHGIESVRNFLLKPRLPKD